MQKRPHEEGQGPSAGSRKKQKTDARVIHVQSGGSTGAGVVKNSLAGLPGAIDVEKFVEARSFEITAMQSAMESARGASTQRAWQSLPRSLRRRAASHDVRRVPVRLRGKARAEMDPAKRKAGKRPPKLGKSKQVSRTQSFLKRQRDKTWLETHLWHAKRMHMKNVWGYRLSETPTEKSYRPSHRSAIHASILHDASYMSTISVSGRQSLLEKMLIRCCDCQGAGPGAVRYTLGSRVHNTHLYKPDTYPFGLVAPAMIMWKPMVSPASSSSVPEIDDTSTKETQLKSKRQRRRKGKEKEVSSDSGLSKPNADTLRTIWIRIHPSAWQEVWDTIRAAASLSLDEVRQGADEQGEDHIQGKYEINNAGQDSQSEESIEMVDLRTQVNCFELMGPRSSQVLRGVMTLVNGDERPIFHQFWAQLNDLQSPGSVPRGMIIGLKVHDPRLNFPPKNVKIATQTDDKLPSTSVPAMFSVFPNALLAKSELWDEAERPGGGKRPRFRKKDLDERRRQNLIPGTALQPLRQDDRVPIMLIQRTVALPPSQSSSTCSNNEIETMHGWTILLPPHWSMPFFNSLIYTGTRVGGLRERRTQVFEAGCPDFPFDYPLTPAYTREEAISERVERERWERKPPSKRVEWGSVGTKSPWRADWEAVLGFPARRVSDDDLLDVQRDPLPGTKTLINDGNDGSGDASWLLRGPEGPAIMEALSTAEDPAATLLGRINELRAKKGLQPLQMDGGGLLKGALVLVKLDMCGRGTPDDLAAIYEVGCDEGNELRRMLAKKRGDIEGDADVELSKLFAGDSTIIGYVTTGKYSLSRGKGHAIGAVSVARLAAIMGGDKNLHVTSYSRLVKVKNREGTVCRAATVEILTT